MTTLRWLGVGAAGCLLLGAGAAAAVRAPGLPDPALTPGATATTDTAQICAYGYSRAHRHTSDELKDWVMREYGMTSRRGYEIDHLVSLCLGGADVAANLWPQPYSGPWNAHMKDDLEVHACREVCAGRLAIGEAQSWFLGDWRAAYCRVFDRKTCIEKGGHPIRFVRDFEQFWPFKSWSDPAQQRAHEDQPESGA